MWNRDLYKGGSAEWDERLLDAMEFDEIQALKSASFGLGQVMGFNYTAAGCASIQQFIPGELCRGVLASKTHDELHSGQKFTGSSQT